MNSSSCCSLVGWGLSSAGKEVPICYWSIYFMISSWKQHQGGGHIVQLLSPGSPASAAFGLKQKGHTAEDKLQPPLFQYPPLSSSTNCFWTHRYFFPPFLLPDRNLNASLRPRQLCLSPNVKVTLQAASLHRPALPMPTWSSSCCLRTPAEASSDGKRSPLPTQGNHRKKHLSFFKQPSLQPAARAEAGGKPPSSHMQMSFPNGGVLTSTSLFQPRRDALNTPSSPRAAA